MADLYSVEVINNDGTCDVNEFEKFRNSMILSGGRDKRQLIEVEALIQEVVEITGATESMFRSEGIFRAIPSHPDKYRFWQSDGETHFGLRLYCVIVSEQVLILLNGCSKTHQKVKKCPNCKSPFEFAEKFSMAFFDALNVNHKIGLEGRDIYYEDENWILNF